MWNKSVSVGCVTMCAAWLAAFVLIAVGWATENVYVAHMGLGISALAASLTIVRDNQRTRAQIRAAGRPDGGSGGTVRQFVRPDRY